MFVFENGAIRWKGNLDDLKKVYRRTKSWSFLVEWSETPFPEPTQEELEKWSIITTATVYLAPPIFAPGLRVNAYPQYLAVIKDMGSHTLDFFLDLYDGHVCIYADVKKYEYWYEEEYNYEEEE